MKSFRRLYEEIQAQRRTQRKGSRISFKQFIADQSGSDVSNASSRNLTKNEIRSAIKTVMTKRLRNPL